MRHCRRLICGGSWPFGWDEDRRETGELSERGRDSSLSSDHHCSHSFHSSHHRHSPSHSILSSASTSGHDRSQLLLHPPSSPSCLGTRTCGGPGWCCGACEVGCVGVDVMMRGYCWFYVESLGCGLLVVMSRHCCCCWCGSRGISVGSWFCRSMSRCPLSPCVYLLCHAGWVWWFSPACYGWV